VNRRGIKLVPKDVVEGEKSKGATLVDPLAALGEGYILKTIEEAIATTIPGRQTSKAGGLKTDVKVKSLEGRAGVLVVDGTITVTAPEPKER
jgi:hypothetical protein